MKFADNRDLREELYMTYMSKSFKGGAFDNQENIRKIVNLRMELANLLGYSSYADYVLEQLAMATNRQDVYRLLEDLYTASYPAALKEKRGNCSLRKKNRIFRGNYALRTGAIMLKKLKEEV